MTVEQRYRRIIRLFPNDWRERNGDALLDTLLEHADSRLRWHHAANYCDLLRTAATLHWRALIGSTVRSEVTASISLAASAGLASMAAVSVGLIARGWMFGYGLRHGGLVTVDMVVATILLVMWPATLLLAATGRTTISARIAGTTTVLLAMAYLARSTWEFNFVSTDYLFLYLGLAAVTTWALSTAAKSRHKIDMRWIAVTGVLAVPFTAAATGATLHRIWVPPQSYFSPVFAIVTGVVVVSAPVILALGIFQPRLLLAGALLYTPLSAAGIGQLFDSSTIHDPGPGQAIPETTKALVVAAGSLLPAATLLMAVLAVTLHQGRREGAR